jgi:hypothetical protein
MALTFPESSGAPEPIQPQPEGEGKAICEDTMCRIPGKIRDRMHRWRVRGGAILSARRFEAAGSRWRP